MQIRLEITSKIAGWLKKYKIKNSFLSGCVKLKWLRFV